VISVLLPSRGRPKALTESIASLLDHADRPGTIQVLVAADPDDQATITTDLPWQATVWTAPERYGYSRLHKYVNRLGEMAEGEWLMLWNDDARLLTPGWDTAVHQRPRGVLWPHSNDVAGCNTFPIWPAAWTTALGHVSLSPHCDSWIQDLGQAVGRHERVDIEILHDRADLTGGHDDQTRADSLAGYRTQEYHHPDMQQARANDTTALRLLLTYAELP
jgi:hypothetical protein